MLKWTTKKTIDYQSEEDANQLNDISVSDTVQSSEHGVCDGNSSADDDGQSIVHIKHNREDGS